MEILIFIVVVLGLILVDKKINFSDRRKLTVLFIAINLLIFFGFQYIYTSWLLANPAYGDLLVVIKKVYLVLMAAGLMGLAGLEYSEGKSLKKPLLIGGIGLVFLLMLALARLSVLVFPLILNLFLTKVIVRFFYPNLKLNYVLAHRRHLYEGYDDLKIKGPYNKYFYRGDFFVSRPVNQVFSFFSLGYPLNMKRKNLIYGTENIDSEYNLSLIKDFYEADGDRLVIFNKIELAENNRYEESDVFSLGEITEVMDGDFFKDYFANQLINYPKVDFEYMTYVIDLTIARTSEQVRLFDLNKVRVDDIKIRKNYSLKMENLKDDELISKYLHELVEKDMIYNQIVDFITKGNETIYRIERSREFRLAYDQGARCFTVNSEKLGVMGRFSREKTLEIMNINQPLEDRLIFEDRGYEGGYQKYALFSHEEADEKPYYIYSKFFIEVDLTNAVKLGRPEFSLIVEFDLELSL